MDKKMETTWSSKQLPFQVLQPLPEAIFPNAPQKGSCFKGWGRAVQDLRFELWAPNMGPWLFPLRVHIGYKPYNPYITPI